MSQVQGMLERLPAEMSGVFLAITVIMDWLIVFSDIGCLNSGYLYLDLLPERELDILLPIILFIIQSLQSLRQSYVVLY